MTIVLDKDFLMWVFFALICFESWRDHTGSLRSSAASSQRSRMTQGRQSLLSSSQPPRTGSSG